jgi:hypothetical protein
VAIARVVRQAGAAAGCPEFEARLRMRDESKTKKLAPEEKLSKAERKEQERRK